jgi:hypothetical protein
VRNWFVFVQRIVRLRGLRLRLWCWIRVDVMRLVRAIGLHVWTSLMIRLRVREHVKIRIRFRLRARSWRSGRLRIWLRFHVGLWLGFSVPASVATIFPATFDWTNLLDCVGWPARNRGRRRVVVLCHRPTEVQRQHQARHDQ